MKQYRNLIRTALLAALLVWICGCGYTTDNLIRDDIGSVHVGYFENNTWRQGLEVDLRRALSEEVRLHGGLKHSAHDTADTIIEGELLDYSVRAATRDMDERVLMKRVRVKVRYRWLDGLSGREIVTWTDMERDIFLPAADAENEAVRAFREIAQLLIEDLEREW